MKLVGLQDKFGESHTYSSALKNWLKVFWALSAHTVFEDEKSKASEKNRSSKQGNKNATNEKI